MHPNRVKVAKMLIHCENCGNKLETGDNHCDYCGAELIPVTGLQGRETNLTTLFIGFIFIVVIVMILTKYGLFNYIPLGPKVPV